MNKNHHHRIEKTLRFLTFICLTITTFISGCTDKDPSVPERTVFVEPFFSKHQQETLLLHRPGALRVGRDDYLYLLDAGYQHILKFSSDGSPVDTIGKRGQGPGELSRVRNFVLDPENNLYVLDDALHRVSIFRNNGEFVNAFTYDGASASSIAVSDDGDISLYQSAADHSMITVYDNNGVLLRTIPVLDKQEMIRDAGSPEATQFVGTYINRAFIDYNKRSELCILFLSKYEYARLSSNGERMITTELEGPAIDSLRAKEQAFLDRSRQRGERGRWIMNYFSDFVTTTSGNSIILPSNIPILHKIDVDGNLQKVYRLQLSERSYFHDFSIDRIAMSRESELIASDSQNATLWRIKLK